MAVVDSASDLPGELKSLEALTDVERAVLAGMLQRRRTAADPNRTFDAQLTFGQRVADRAAAFGGSWTFIGLFLLALAAWIVVQVLSERAVDPYPFVLLNLVLSCVAALQAPVILMSQNRLAAKHRVDAHHDYQVNLRAEMEVMGVHDKLDAMLDGGWAELLALQREQRETLSRIEHLLADRGSSAP